MNTTNSMVQAKDEIVIAMASDAAYSCGLFATASSIAMTASHSAHLHYVFLDGGCGRDFFSKLQQSLQRLHPNVRITVLSVSESKSVFADFPNWRGSKLAYARLLLPSLLKETKHVIYCDVDFIWLADIAKLWAQRDDSVIHQAVVDPQVGETAEKSWFEERGLRFDVNKYFCSGLMLMNLEMFRKENIANKAYAFITEHPDLLFVDQSALNAILDPDRHRLLNPQWMRFTRYLKPKDLTPPIVLHYVNRRPWQNDSILECCFDLNYIWYHIVSISEGVPLITILKRFLPSGKALIVATMSRMLRIPFLRQLLLLLIVAAGKKSFANSLAANSSVNTISCIRRNLA